MTGLRTRGSQWLERRAPGVFRLGEDVRLRGWRQAYRLALFRKVYGTRRAALAAAVNRLAPYPTYLEIETTTRCGLRCVMCERTYWEGSGRDIDPAEFHRLLLQFPDLCWIGLTGIGESFLHRDFFHMLEAVKARRAFVELFDTLRLVDAGKAERLVRLGVDRILVSLDAATRETYAAIRVNSDFDRVLENVRALVAARRCANSRFPSIEFHFIVMRPNLHEAVSYLRLVHDLSGPGTPVLYSRLLHEYPEVRELFLEVPASVRHAVEEEGRRLGLRVHWNANAAESKPSCRLCTEWTMPFIFATGEVIPCCAQNEANLRDRQRQLAMGNAFRVPFRDLWHGDSYRELRRALREGHQLEVCRGCPLYASET